MSHHALNFEPHKQIFLNMKKSAISAGLLLPTCFSLVVLWSHVTAAPTSVKAVTIITRAQWGARAPKSTTTLTTPVTYAFIHHSEGTPSTDLASGKRIVKGIQDWHMDGNKWSDIGYSFLIGGDGSIFEGRGWNRVGAHTQGYNSNGYGICFLGSFTSSSPTAAAISSAQALIADAVSRGYLKRAYVLKGHRQVGSTSCPGDKLYQLIQSWSNWKA